MKILNPFNCLYDIQSFWSNYNKKILTHCDSLPKDKREPRYRQSIACRKIATLTLHASEIKLKTHKSQANKGISNGNFNCWDPTVDRGINLTQTSILMNQMEKQCNLPTWPMKTTFKCRFVSSSISSCTSTCSTADASSSFPTNPKFQIWFKRSYASSNHNWL